MVLEFVKGILNTRKEVKGLSLKIGKPAPDFTLNSTRGKTSLSDYRGKWVVLFTHPADFTPICSTEIPEFARRQKEFEELNAQLLGASVDSVFSHIAWIESLEKNTGTKIRFPILADLHQEIAKKYEVLDEESGFTFRGVFVIDPEGILKYIIYHPMEVGRSVTEILRVLKALQTGKLTPVEWKPGDKFVEPPKTKIQD